MKGRKVKYLIAGGIVLAALAGLVYSGVRESMEYFYTPTEVREKTDSVRGKALRVGGMVEEGSIRWDAQQVLLTFALTDGKSSVPVRHKGFAFPVIEGTTFFCPW